MREAMSRRRSHKYRLFVLIAFSLCAAFSGCLSRRADISRAAGDFSSPEAVLHRLDKTAPAEGTLKAIAAIQVATPAGAYPLKLAVMLRRPALMRVEAIPVLGLPNFYLSIHEDRLKVLLPDKNEFYAGRATRENIAMFLPLRIDVESMVSLLMGVPPAATGKDLHREGSVGGDSYLIDIRDGGRRIQSLRVRLTDGLIEDIDIYGNGEKALYRVHYEDHVRSGESVTPRKITIVAEEDGTTLTIGYSEIEWTAERDDSLFDLKAPPGVKQGHFP
jgi:hypothetical protein